VRVFVRILDQGIELLESFPAVGESSTRNELTSPSGRRRPHVAQERYSDLCIEIEPLEVVEPGKLAMQVDSAIKKYGLGRAGLAAWKRSYQTEVRERRRGFIGRVV